MRKKMILGAAVAGFVGAGCMAPGRATNSQPNGAAKDDSTKEESASSSARLTPVKDEDSKANSSGRSKAVEEEKQKPSSSAQLKPVK